MRKVGIAEMNAFVAIAERSSFAKAAGHLRVSRSSLSETMRSLEEKLGVRLLNRTTRSVALTEAGERLLPGGDARNGRVDAGSSHGEGQLASDEVRSAPPKPEP